MAVGLKGTERDHRSVGFLPRLEPRLVAEPVTLLGPLSFDDEVLAILHVGRERFALLQL